MSGIYFTPDNWDSINNEFEKYSQDTFDEAISRYFGDCIYEEGFICHNIEKKNNKQCDKCGWYIYYFSK